MKNTKCLINITSYNDLKDFQVDLLSIMVKYYCKKFFYGTKPQFKFQYLMIRDTFHSFFFSIDGIDYKITLSINEIQEFLKHRVINKYNLAYFNYYEKNVVISINYDKSHLRNVFGGIKFYTNKFKSDEKKTYGMLSYLYIKIRRLLNVDILPALKDRDSY